MRSKPRTFCLRSFVSLALFFAFTSTPALSQLQRGRAKTSSAAQNKDIERARRAQAVDLLIETADKARLFDDLFYRARIQMLAADALWPDDEQQARAIFRRAWEAATAYDKAEREQQATDTGALPSSIEQVTDARDEVLKKVAVRDAKLAGIFLHDLLDEKDNKDKADANKSQPAPRTAWHYLSANGAYRLDLAYQTLNDGQTRNAVQIAAPLINEGVSVEMIEFILSLRERSANDADALYSQLLERAADPQTDANAVLLLSAPIVSPGLLVAADEFGSLQFRALRLAANHAAQQSIPANMQAAFFNLAASVLSRPAASSNEQLAIQDLMAQFYAIGRLLPYFENSSAPYAMYAPALRLRQNELSNQIEANHREQASSQFNTNSMTQTGATDPLRHYSEELARTTNPAERERIAIQMVKMATSFKSWDRAKRAAAELENEDVRRAALSFIQVNQIKDLTDAFKDEKENDYEGVAKFVREANVPPFAKAWGLAQVAVIASRKRGPQAAQHVTQILNEAESYAARVEQGTPERVAAYSSVLMAAAQLDPPRAWTLLRELVRSANSVEDFTGDDTGIDLTGDENSTDAGALHFSIGADVFRLEIIFATMAHLDFDKALAEARALDGHVPQAFAMIAIAKSRSQQEKQNSESRSQKPE
ncbi:MAG: hypothetical protein QOC96_3515 [Acidobacteriota bacterium]|nr:hypothetical protein [Acidobacteriota bacterium]